jgi:hypothetical protein
VGVRPERHDVLSWLGNSEPMASVSWGAMGRLTKRQRRHGRRAWVTKVRTNPKEAMEADLGVAGAGLFIFILGGLLAVAGYHPGWQNVHNSSPAPLVGNVIAGIGLLVGAVGVLLLVVSVVVLMGGWRRQKPN